MISCPKIAFEVIATLQLSAREICKPESHEMKWPTDPISKPPFQLIKAFSVNWQRKAILNAVFSRSLIDVIAYIVCHCQQWGVCTLIQTLGHR